MFADQDLLAASADVIWGDLWALLRGRARPESYRAWTSAFTAIRNSRAELPTDALAAINKRFLSRFGMSLGPHGIQVPFAHRDAPTVSAMLEGGDSLARDLQSFGFDACLGFGTALGFARSGMPIPHDDDVDLLAMHTDCVCESRSECMSVLAEACRDSGYTVSGSHSGHLWVAKGHNYDVFVAAPTRGTGVCEFLVGNRPYRHRIDDIFPAGTMRFGDGTLGQLPRNIVVYVQDVYGTSWREPDPSFVH
jgi:hypothetical protein